jgi:FlaA1/EpsC-like NDP-sugar epimerase
MTITDIADAFGPDLERREVGIQPGEKLHEQMIGAEDALYTFDYGDYYKILPTINLWDRAADMVKGGKPVAADFEYVSDTNDHWMSVDELRSWITANLGSSPHTSPNLL